MSLASQAVAGIPGVCFAEELISTYPSAKIILTARPFDAWHTSMSRTILAYLRPNPFFAPIYALLSLLDPQISLLAALSRKTLPAIGGNGSREEARILYERHYSEIKQMVPAERVLEWSVEEGWERLCAFLER